MSRWHRVRKVANNLLSGIQLANRQDLVDPFFKKLQAFGRCEGKSPADKRHVHAVFAVIRKWARSMALTSESTTAPAYLCSCKGCSFRAPTSPIDISWRQWLPRWRTYR